MAIGSDPTEEVQARTYRLRSAVGVEDAGESEAQAREPDPAELVHETRKTIKRMRALARLMRNELGKQEFKRINSSLREAGQRLGGARDAEVRLATLQELVERHPKALARSGIERLQEQLEAIREQTVAPSDRQEVLRDIAAMREQLARLNLIEHDFDSLAPGLRRIYREGRQRRARVKRGYGRNPQDAHDWRKRVKSLYYALDMLGGKDAKGARGATRRADRLGELLGEEHDLWMLDDYVREHREAFGVDAGAQAVLAERIERRRRRLRKRALELGAHLYKRKPGRFTRRIGRSLSR
jgi:CHAD domain-containing protein